VLPARVVAMLFDVILLAPAGAGAAPGPVRGTTAGLPAMPGAAAGLPGATAVPAGAPAGLPGTTAPRPGTAAGVAAGLAGAAAGFAGAALGGGAGCCVAASTAVVPSVPKTNTRHVPRSFAPDLGLCE
jgi:hypothetical protein